MKNLDLHGFFMKVYIPLINANGLNDTLLNGWGLMRFLHNLETVKFPNIYPNVYLI